MHNIEYLTEQDLKYFEKKEALGEAIIIRIEPEALLLMDLDELFSDRDKDQTLSAEELESFLHGKQRKKESMPGDITSTSEEVPMTGIEANLQHIILTADERASLLHLIDSGISDEELMEILQGQGS